MANIKDYMLNLRLEQGDVDRLDALVAAHPLASRSVVARIALRHGLALLEQRPELVARGEPPAARRPRRGKRR